MNPIKKCFNWACKKRVWAACLLESSGLLRETKPFWGTITRTEKARFCKSYALPSSIGRCIFISLFVTWRKKSFALLKKKIGKGSIRRLWLLPAQGFSDLPFLSIQISLQEIHSKHKRLPCNKHLLRIEASFMYLASVGWNNPVIRIWNLKSIPCYWCSDATSPLTNTSGLDDKLSIRESSSVWGFLCVCVLFWLHCCYMVLHLLFEFYHCYCHQPCSTEKKLPEWAYNHKYFNLLNKWPNCLLEIYFSSFSWPYWELISFLVLIRCQH